MFISGMHFPAQAGLQKFPTYGQSVGNLDQKDADELPGTYFFTHKADIGENETHKR